MVFSTVQISMPGTSWARTSADASTEGARATDTTRAIRPIMEILVQVSLITPNCTEPAQDVKDTTLKPHSRVEVLRKTPNLMQGRGARRGTQRGACPPLLRRIMEWQRA